MKWLLDTCVISEIARPDPNRKVVAWISEQRMQSLHMSVLTLGELTKGIFLLPDGARRRRLHTWLQNELKTEFEGRWIDVDAEVAERWAMISGEATRSGTPMATTDALIAASALVHGMTVVTLNAPTSPQAAFRSSIRGINCCPGIKSLKDDCEKFNPSASEPPTTVRAYK